MERITLKLKQIAFVSSLAFVMVSCNAQTNEKKTAVIEVQEELLLNPVAFSERLSQEEQPQIIDVRTPQEFKNGTIENAVNWNVLDGTFEQNIQSLDSSKSVYVFCAKGGRSGKAASILKEKGFISVIDLKGGYGAWELFNVKQ